MEMTVMMVAERDIPLAELRNKLLDTQHIRLRQTLYKEDLLKPLAHKHRVLLAKIKLSAMGELQPTSSNLHPFFMGFVLHARLLYNSCCVQCNIYHRDFELGVKNLFSYFILAILLVEA